jgi:hypothetical protein
MMQKRIWKWGRRHSLLPNVQIPWSSVSCLDFRVNSENIHILANFEMMYTSDQYAAFLLEARVLVEFC